MAQGLKQGILPIVDSGGGSPDHEDRAATIGINAALNQEAGEALLATRSRRRAERVRDVSPDVTRHVLTVTQLLLWGRAAGRCEFAGCNRPLWKSDVTQETRNIAQKAHIRAFSAGGPRANEAWPRSLVNDVNNLMLLCHVCHVTIDQADGPERYTAVALDVMKRQHEARVEIVTAIAPRHASHVVTYGTHVGEHQALPTFHLSA